MRGGEKVVAGDDDGAAPVIGTLLPAHPDRRLPRMLSSPRGAATGDSGRSLGAVCGREVDPNLAALVVVDGLLVGPAVVEGGRVGESEGLWRADAGVVGGDEAGIGVFHVGGVDAGDGHVLGVGAVVVMLPQVRILQHSFSFISDCLALLTIFRYLALLDGGFVPGANVVVRQPDPDRPGASEVVGPVVDLTFDVAEAEHLADDPGLLLAEVVVADRAPDALVPDLDPPRVLPLAVGQPDLERG